MKFTTSRSIFAAGLACLRAQNPEPAVPAPPVPARPAAAAPEPKLDWYDVTKWGVEGRAWDDLERHPSDLGFVRQAAVFEPVLRKALGE